MYKNKIHPLLTCIILFLSALSNAKQLKILHLSFHRGCINDFEYVAKQLNLDLTSCYIHDQPPLWLDGETKGSTIYTIGHNRAEKIWKKHQDYFNQFDVVVTSDTAPLARIFLQNNWKKPLIIWICNRFDYCDQASRDCHFPDPEFYQLFRDALYKKNVHIAAYTPFEHYYTKLNGVDTGTNTIKPCAQPMNVFETSLIPEHVRKQETFFIPPYHNDTIFCNLAQICTQLGIPVYNGRYAGPGDLQDFKGIIHIPYAWSNLALFENLQNGVPYFIPSQKFILELRTQGDFFFNMMDGSTVALSEWYLPENKAVFIYFDSWADLAEKVRTTNFPACKQRIKKFAQNHHDTMLARWNQIFEQCIK